VQQGSEALNLEQALRIIRRRVPLIAFCVVVVAGAAYLFSKHETKKYTATASLAFSYNSLSQQIAGLQGVTGNLLAQQASNLELVRLGDMAARTASLLGHGLTYEKVSNGLSIKAQGESSIVNVSATDTSPRRAATIANTYVRLFVEEQQRTNRQYFRSALAIVNRQLARLSPQQRLGEDGLSLQDRAQTLRLLTELKYGNVQIAQEAVTPTVPSSPNTSRNTELGVLLGLLIGLGLAFVLERLDSRIKGAEDLEEIYRVPLLGIVPASAALAHSGRPRGGEKSVLPPADAEAFNLIRAHLRFFNVDHELRTIVIGSASPGDGKTTIARHLAEAAARLGSRVLLLEVDLRQPTLAGHFGLPPGPGLADVLIGSVSMGDAIESIDLTSSEAPTSTQRTLDVLLSGSMRPPNPAELIESHAMGAVLQQAESAYDLVIIDTPPLTAVSDALPLLAKVDGVVIAGWVGRSPRDAAVRLHQVLDSSGAPVLGVIANGAKSGGASPYVTNESSSEKRSSVAGSVNAGSASEELGQTIGT
jgi:capsular exopolysaccharide synthesis family protein